MAWQYDPAHSSVGFAIRHMGLSTVRGSFGDVAIDVQSFDIADATGARGTVKIRTESINTGDARRDEHLRNADFFDAPAYEHITFEVTGVTHRSGDQYAVDGILTIKDVSKPVTLDAEFNGESPDLYGNHRVGMSLTGSISRYDFGLRFNAPIGADRVLVAEKVKLDIEIQLLQPVEAPAADPVAAGV